MPLYQYIHTVYVQKVGLIPFVLAGPLDLYLQQVLECPLDQGVHPLLLHQGDQGYQIGPKESRQRTF